ncbi:ABC transporter substrate-binding protein [Micromonospora polyrhachis]|uniref:Branched-chain amino acid transport system substrate-binding protein n=1 Tax=Micromonospora polyrhachis TaxID=1282883 RepID=A0A7W7SQD8_9ACTN|nr:ABC transporter substrate-binding protein [Micromonospora polyrhachis]MBB4959047.1 branched-chain amino acid transport system substrate-binding protein [Micromonospora polyrhachis]
MSQISRRQALSFLAALGAAGLTTACGTDSDPRTDPQLSDDPIRIGLVAPRNGGDKPIGDEIVNGFRLYLELNDQLLGGHPVTLVTADEGETVATGTAAVDDLLKQGVLALTGVAGSAVMLGIRDTVEQAQVPLVGSNASPTALEKVDYIWRTSFRDDESGRALGAYVASQLVREGKLVIIAPDHPAGRDAVTGLQESFGRTDPRLVEPVIWTDATSNPTPSTYRAKITQLTAAKPDAIFCPYGGTAAIAFLRQLRAAGYRNQVYGPGSLTEGIVLDEFKPAEIEGIMTALNYSTDLTNAVNRRFASAYRKQHGASPTTYAVASYDAAQVLDKAIRIAGVRPSPQQVNVALGKVGRIDSPRGVWQFNDFRTPLQKWYLRNVQHDGQLLANVLVNELATLG